MPDISHQHQTDQRITLGQVVIDRLLPLVLRRTSGFGVAVAWQVDQSSGGFKVEEIQELGSSGSFTDLCHVPIPCKAVED